MCLMGVADTVGSVACYAVNKRRRALEVDFQICRLVVADIKGCVGHYGHSVVEHKYCELARAACNDACVAVALMACLCRT